MRMTSKRVEPSEVEQLDDTPTKPAGAWDFEEIVAKADKLGKMAKEAAEESVKISQRMIARAEEISQQAKEASEARTWRHQTKSMKKQ
jgi:hypothetical protein